MIRWTAWLAGGVVYLGVLGFFVFIAISSFPNSQAADAGEGDSGVYTVLSIDCHEQAGGFRRARWGQFRERCSARGTWVSDDGKTTREDVVMSGNHEVGDTYTVIMFPGDGRLYETDRKNVLRCLTVPVLIGVGGLAVGALAWWSLIGRYRRQGAEPMYLPTQYGH